MWDALFCRNTHGRKPGGSPSHVGRKEGMNTKDELKRQSTSRTSLSMDSVFESSGLPDKIGEITMDSNFSVSDLDGLVATDANLTSGIDYANAKQPNKSDAKAVLKKEQSAFTKKFMDTEHSPKTLDQLRFLSMGPLEGDDVLNDVVATEESIRRVESAPSFSKIQNDATKHPKQVPPIDSSETSLTLGLVFDSSGLKQKFGEITLDSFYDESALDGVVASDANFTSGIDYADATQPNKSEASSKSSTPVLQKEPSAFTKKFMDTDHSPKTLDQLRFLSMGPLEGDDMLEDVVATEESIRRVESAPSFSKHQNNSCQTKSKAAPESSDTSKKTETKRSILKSSIKKVNNTSKDFSTKSPKKGPRVTFDASLDSSEKSLASSYESSDDEKVAPSLIVKEPSKSSENIYEDNLPEDTKNQSTNNSVSNTSDCDGFNDAYDKLNDPRKLQETIIEDLRNQLLEMTVEKNANSKQIEDMKLKQKQLELMLKQEKESVETKLKSQKDSLETDMSHWIERCSSLKTQTSRLEKQLKAAKADAADRSKTVEEKIELAIPERKPLDPDGQCAEDQNSIEDKIKELEFNYNKKLQQLNSHIVMLNSEVGFWKQQNGEIKMQYELLDAKNVKTENEFGHAKQVIKCMQKQLEKLTRALALKEKQLKSQSLSKSRVPNRSKIDMNSSMATGSAVKMSLGDVKMASSGRNSLRRMSNLFHQHSIKHTFNNEVHDVAYFSDHGIPLKKATQQIRHPSILRNSRHAVERAKSSDSIEVDAATRTALDLSISWKEDIDGQDSILRSSVKSNFAMSGAQSDGGSIPRGAKPKLLYNTRESKNSPSEGKHSTRPKLSHSKMSGANSTSDSESSSPSQSHSSSSLSSSSSTSSDEPAGLQQIKPLSLNNSAAGALPKQSQPQSILKAPHKESPTREMASQSQTRRSSLSKQHSLDLMDVFENNGKRSGKHSIELAGESMESIVIPNDMDPDIDLVKTKSKQRKTFNSRMLKSASYTSNQSTENDPNKSSTESSVVSIHTNPTVESSTSESISSDYSTSTSEDSSCASEDSASFAVGVPSIKMRSQQELPTCCAVSHMPYKYKQLDANGLYSGHIDIASKLPNGFGALKCDNGDIFSGTWKMGVL